MHPMPLRSHPLPRSPPSFTPSEQVKAPYTSPSSSPDRHG
ncbi:hypothetical protein SNL152K_10737 [Streptomyces sp. NL15-2K]|nr:hypothetical protein SNL152K_10737 [Streptomyces sp. NL15-2K]